MKYKYKYLILSFITIGNLVSSPVFALTGETKTSESTTTTTETVPITESLNKETDKKTNSSSMPEVSEDTCKEENTKNTSVVENKENSKEEKARKVKFSNSKAIKTESSNWQVEDKGNYVLLKKYTGSGKHIVVPGDFYGKPTKLKGIDKSVFPNMNSAKSFEVLLRYDGAKVGLESQTLDSAFENTSFESINLSGLDTSNVTNMRSMFRSCHVLTNLDLSCFDTSNVTNMSSMFYECKALASLDVSHFDTSNVTNMPGMFEYCTSLKSLDVSHFDTSNVTNMLGMFGNCYTLKSLDVSHFDTSNVTNMSCMFANCYTLKSLDLSHFDTSNVTDMSCMFYGCKALASLDLSHFDTSNVTNMNNMFYGLNDPGGIVIITKDFKISNYAFPGDVRSLVTPVLVANGGRFPTTVNKYYFTKIVYTPEEFGKINTVTAFEQFKKENIPTKNGVDFLGWELISGNDSSAQNVYPDLYGVEYRAKWGKKDYGKIQIPSQDTDNVKPDHSSIYGIAYMPKVFNFVSKLEDSGNQIIPLTNAGSHNYHVAVRDQRMIKDSWVLQAQLMWDGKEIPGAEILTLHQGNNVLKNINNGEKDFTNNDLIECPTNDVSGVQKVVIGSSGPIPIMTAQDVEHNAVYDYDLGNVTLRIPETKYVQPGKYSGNIEWNLIKGP
ncbi:BspA family leucine-rich repeat surface protein [Enterococcus hirae]